MPMISAFEIAYLISWSLALVAASIFMVRHRMEFELLSPGYWRFLTEPWKIITFLIATMLLILAAPYSGDHTWDTPDSILTSLFTYGLAPWSVAIIVRAVRRRSWSVKSWVALTLFMVPCWVYDLYILLRDQMYPPTWWSNIPISGAIIATAGMLWNLTYKEGVGAIFAFSEEDWPPTRNTAFRSIALPAFIIMVPVTFSVAWFVITFLWG